MKKINNELVIESFEDFLVRIGLNTPETRYFYRGISNSKYKLIPSIGRCESSFGYNSGEENIFKKFKNQALPYLKKIPKTDLEWLILAQHHGLPTRLLDWTSNPLVALFFSVNKNKKEDGLIFITTWKSPSNYSELSLKANNPFSVETSELFYPPHISSRVTNQSSLLSIQNNPKEEFNAKTIKKIIIPHILKNDIQIKLATLGIHESFLFPGLEGLIKKLKFMNNLNM
ncbi:MAG: FRG domain-containing protein [Candidatus Gracilibacteria bacterium]|nr:FRG domain-containing protein [Candidatus Gracilibacteria bacterium]MDQ7023914.1 FRG domain-containing protein [Candidatus Gracilibacteria bacterium]